MRTLCNLHQEYLERISLLCDAVVHHRKEAPAAMETLSLCSKTKGSEQLLRPSLPCNLNSDCCLARYPSCERIPEAKRCLHLPSRIHSLQHQLWRDMGSRGTSKCCRGQRSERRQQRRQRRQAADQDHRTCLQTPNPRMLCTGSPS